MSLNLSGSQFGEFQIGHAQQNASGIMNTNLKAVLFVFRPYQGQFEDVSLRPFNYRFDTNFLNDVQKVTDMSTRTELSPTAQLAGMKQHLNFNDYIMPTRVAQMTFKASQLSHNHRFILILTDDATGLVAPNTQFSTGGNNKQRRIYTGYFLDEPYAPGIFGGGNNLNPHATMIITHKTVVGMMGTSDQWGYRERLSTHVSDEIFNPTVTTALTSVNVGGYKNDIHLMTPENCLSGVDMTAEGDTLVMPGVHSEMSKQRANSSVSSILEQPDHNVTHIVRGMIRHVDEQNNKNIMLGRSTAASFDDRYVTDELARASMHNHLMLPRGNLNSRFDLDINSNISPVDIDNLVNQSLEVIPINLDRPSYYDTMDQTEASITNQYSFLISAVVIPILSGAGLDSLQFTYEIAKIRGVVESEFRIANPMANYPVSDVELANIIRAVQYELEQGIFKTIYESVGDFGVTVGACVTGMTSVRLNLVGMGINNPVDFEFPSCMGGLVSPLIGDAASHGNNSENIEGVFNIAMGKNNTPSYFNDDDKNFMSLANSFLPDG
jgi:hypothetical protein